MGVNATIAWDKVTGQPYIPQVPSYIQSTKITQTTIESPNIFGGAIAIGSGNNIFKADSNGISLGNACFGSAPFRVDMGGRVTASNINITGGSINVNTDAKVGNNLTVGETICLSTTSMSGGIRWGMQPGTNPIYIDPAANALHIISPNAIHFHSPNGVFANGRRIDTPQVAVFG
ncbi:hypothetical protein [Paenibacillus sp. HGH0039]|nr:hypothetical protein [Paenibacillus sp. HGH0039]EPD81274.1 hypothetical protein HMPREF1207_05031 [Paenibacillus sp. HGH0039]